jgi:hypothetical protein
MGTINTKADLGEIMDVRDLVAQLPRVSDVNNLKSYVVENIENFSSDNQSFTKEFKTQTKIIK